METNLPVRDAVARILTCAAALPAERVPLRDARARVLREDARADEDSPRFDASAMDGYALRRADAQELLRVVGEIQAGTDAKFIVEPGTCVRIFTGARVPEGADTVVMQEDVQRTGEDLRITSISGESHIRHRGENARRGDVILRAGHELQSADLAALANCGTTAPLVTRRPRVVHLVTGDELVDASEQPRGTQIRDTNSVLVASFLDAAGAQLIRHARLPDSLDASKKIADTLTDDFDLLLVSGGASVGAYDFAKPLLEHAGFSIRFQNVNLRPGKPLAFFKRGNSLAFALPGNPVSHWVILNLFIAPLLAALSGRRVADTCLIGRVATDALQKPNRRETHVPAIASLQGNEYRLEPRAFVSSGDVAAIAGANALMKIPAESVGIHAGETATFSLCR